MTFPLGKPILAMLLIAAVCGAAILLRPAPPTDPTAPFPPPPPPPNPAS